MHGPTDADGETLPEPPRARLATLVLCDLVDPPEGTDAGDPTQLARTRRHDDFVRGLLQAHAGTEVDKADGFLLLFERPSQALAFALDYRREAAVAIGDDPRAACVRAGIHVGEVLTWPSTPEARQRGARANTVEGLAKPVAARLFKLARPGQILLSDVAHGLLRRSAGSDARLRWRFHGHWALKGLAAPMAVLEVGEPGLAPLRAPSPGPWGRPAGLARRRLLAWSASALLVLLALAASIHALRPTPAVAFRERDWVVAGSLANLTGDSRFDAGLDVALRMAMEQSRHVNVLPDLRVRDALARMGRAPDTPIDRATGSEIALREGARVVLLPSLAESGGRLRYSLEVVEPGSGATVMVESAEGLGAESALASLGTVVAIVRRQLGETLGSIRDSNEPVPQVTSRSLDALRAYSLAQQSFARIELPLADSHYRNALALDPEFALALVGLSRLRQAYNDLDGALALAEQALALRHRLSAREALYIEAAVHTLRADGDPQQRWRSLYEMYPDFHPAAHNLAMHAYVDNRFDDTLEWAGRAATPQSVTAPVSIFMQGIARLGLGDALGAGNEFARASSLGMRGFTFEIAAAMAVQGDYAAADAMLGREPPATPMQGARRQLARLAFALDRGDWEAARRIAAELEAASHEHAGSSDFASWRISRMLRIAALAIDRRPDSAEARREALEALLDDAILRHAQASAVTRGDTALMVLHLGYLLSREGEAAAAMRALDATAEAVQYVSRRNLADMAAILQARVAMGEGQQARALALLQPRLDGGELYLTRVMAAEVRTRMGAREEALVDLAWLAERRGRAYIEWSGEGQLMVENIIQCRLSHLRAAELLVALGKRVEAAAELAAFERAWPDLSGLDDLVERVERLRAELSPARNPP